MEQKNQLWEDEIANMLIHARNSPTLPLTKDFFDKQSERLQEIQIRPALFKDLEHVAQIHVKSWQQAYIGLIPKEYLDGLCVETKQKNWEEIFQEEKSDYKNLYIAYHNQQPIGFVSFGRGRDTDKQEFGEIYAIYLLQEYWSKAVGFKLFSAAKEALQQSGLSKFYLWVLENNLKAISSYKRWGGVVDYTTIIDDKIGGQNVKEILVNFDFSNNLLP